MLAAPVSAVAAIDTAQAAVAAADPPRRKQRSRLLALRNRKSLAGLAIMGFFVVIAVIGPSIAPYDPSALSRDTLQPPSTKHWLGTTHLGQDVLSQLLVGTRPVLVVGFVAGVAATTLAVIVGVTAGFLGGRTDDALSALSTIFLVLPGPAARHHHREPAPRRQLDHGGPRARRDGVGVGGAGAAGADALPARARLHPVRARHR